MKNCNDCISLYLTQEEQKRIEKISKSRPNHVCMKHFVRVFHKKLDSELQHKFEGEWDNKIIIPCGNCKEGDFKDREVEVKYYDKKS